MSRQSRRSQREARAADEALLRERLERLGMQDPVAVHENRTVLVSFTNRSGLRIHRGYAYASDRTLKAVLAFVNSDRRSLSRRAEREVVAFPVEQFVPPRRFQERRPKLRPGDRSILAALNELHRRMNDTHFGGQLGRVHFRISDRMKTKLGEVSVEPGSSPTVEICLSRRHLVYDCWDEIQHTVLHEMIHQWQAESGSQLDHGPSFRKKAREIGVLPRQHRRA